MNHRAHYLDRPIFISGFQKSGTTLLLSLLDGHPQLVVFPEELHFFQKVLFKQDKAKAIREKTGFKMFLPNWDTRGWTQADSLFREGYPEFNCIEFNQRVEKALQVHRSEKELLLLLIQAFAEVDRINPTCKKYWVSKTPRNEVFFPILRKMFGKDFKLVYLVRDPRDVYLSISKKNEIEGIRGIQDPRRLINFSVYWKTQTNRAIHYEKKHENFFILRYEDLVIDTESTLVRLCNFLQIDYSEDLLRPTRHGKPWGGNSAFSKGFKGISNKPMGRFKEILDPKERSLLEHLLSKELALLDYAETGVYPVVEAGYSAVFGLKSGVPWIEYWVSSLRYWRWYYFKQIYTTLRYIVSSLYLKKDKIQF